MPIYKPGIIQSANPHAYPIVLASQVGGHKVVDTLTDLNNLKSSYNLLLIGESDGAHAVGQIWWVKEESSFYQLTNYDTNTWEEFKIGSGSSSSGTGVQNISNSSSDTSNTYINFTKTVINDDGTSSTTSSQATIPHATETTAGVMTSEDKKTLNNVSSSIDTIKNDIKTAYNLANSSYQYTSNVYKDLSNKVINAQSKADSSYSYTNNLGYKLDNAVQKSDGSPNQSNYIWVGTYAQYKAISNLNATTLYFITGN